MDTASTRVSVTEARRLSRRLAEFWLEDHLDLSDAERIRLFDLFVGLANWIELLNPDDVVIEEPEAAFLRLLEARPAHIKIGPKQPENCTNLQSDVH